MTDDYSIHIHALTRVEGEGALRLDIAQGKITALQLSIYEPPRLFEKTVVGRRFDEIPDMVARICGICPVAYQMSAVQAFENLFQYTPTPWINAMRRLYYCGEWIESHALHIHLLALPDYLGFTNVIAMAERHPAEVRRGLALQHIGNEIIALLGGRSVNPVGACVGGFYQAPQPAKVEELRLKVLPLIEEAEKLVRWVADLAMPQQQHKFIYAALHNGLEYPLCDGTIRVSEANNTTQDIVISEFEQHFKEQQVAYSTALHCLYHGQDYLVGPLARLNINHTYLPERVQLIIAELGLEFPSYNMFQSMLARALEILFALIESEKILSAYTPATSHYPMTLRAGRGFGCTEAPRGLLWHSYTCDELGLVSHCRIVPPTSQNQARIEADLKFALAHIALQQDRAAVTQTAEKIIRNYDPCISCATHFLRLEINRP